MKAHLVNCTYCKHRRVIPGDKKRSISEIERCELTMLPLRKPNEPGRHCPAFQQIGHECESCYNCDVTFVSNA